MKSYEEKEAVLPFNIQNVLPKNKLDRGLFVLMTAGIPAIFLWEIFILRHYNPEPDSTWYAHLSGQGFLFINIVGNLYYMQRTDSSSRHKKFPPVLRPNWNYCHFCELNSPPRSYHCPVCDVCILKRDQHCMFAGCCVGFYNHRYYFMAVFYIMIGSLYALLLQWPHCLEAIGGFHFLPIISLAAPHIAVLFGIISIYGFICALTQIILLCVYVLTSYMLVVQLRCISSGQTIHEKKADIMLYDLGWGRNFLQVLGKRWYAAVLLPFFPSPISGDGISFLTYYDVEEIKNV